MLVIGISCAADDARHKRVLILESFGQPLATANAVALRTTLERELGEPVEVFYVALDVARFSEPEHDVQLRDFLKLRYQVHKLDLVVPLGAPAAHFVARQRKHLFAGTPVVISGIERRRVPPELTSATTSYVAGTVDLRGHIDNVLSLLPGTQRIVMIHGASSYDQFWAQENRRELQAYSQRIAIEWLEGQSFEAVLQKVSGLEEGSVVFLGLIVADATGVQIGRQEALERLREVSKVPIFGYFESYMGHGVVGGRLYADIGIGVEAGRAAIRILRGESPRDVGSQVMPETRPVYDWRELQRFGIDERRLPPGSEVQYRQQTLWQVYRWHIAGIFGLVMIQAALIAGLLVQRERKRRAEAERRQVERELATTRDELAHMTRVFTLGELSSSLAHELNQPLAAILSNAQAAQRFLASENPADREEVREILADIVQADKHAGDVIRRMRSMVKKDHLDAAPLDMTSAVNEVLLLLHNDAGLRNVAISLDAEPGLPAVLGDRIQLQQVVLNLLLNAFEAMTDTHVAERSVQLRVGCEEQVLKVTVTDAGHGLSDESIERVFDAFYSTKPNGLGMGLSISRSIVEAHRGRLWAQNNKTRGATFCFTIPLISSEMTR